MSSNKIIKKVQASTYIMPKLEGMRTPHKAMSQAPAKSPEDIEREAFEKGFASGEKAGYEMGKQQIDLLADRLESILKELGQLKNKIVQELEPQVVLLGISLARRILKEEVSLHPEIIEKMVREGLSKIGKTGPITIKMNQSLWNVLEEKKEDFLSIYPELRFEVDNHLPEEGTVVSCPSGEVHTALEFQLSNIVEELRANLGND